MTDEVTKIAHELNNQRYEIIEQFLKAWCAINWDGKSDLKDFINTYELVETHAGNKISWSIERKKKIELKDTDFFDPTEGYGY